MVLRRELAFIFTASLNSATVGLDGSLPFETAYKSYRENIASPFASYAADNLEDGRAGSLMLWFVIEVYISIRS